jgi:hypothetical protein
MRPNDANRNLSTAERPFRVLIIAGSDRRQYNCPGVDSKARTLMLRMADRFPEQWEIDYEDLGNVFGKEPDLMWTWTWAIIGPLNRYAPTSNLKLMFDRLVCMNGGNPREKTFLFCEWIGSGWV